MSRKHAQRRRKAYEWNQYWAERGVNMRKPSVSGRRQRKRQTVSVRISKMLNAHACSEAVRTYLNRTLLWRRRKAVTVRDEGAK